jgi:hypothetical protein
LQQLGDHTSTGGVGLGLAVAKGFIEAVGDLGLPDMDGADVALTTAPPGRPVRAHQGTGLAMSVGTR